MQREDWEQVIKTPIGMLPTGSGNALCASALYEAGSVHTHTWVYFDKIGYKTIIYSDMYVELQGVYMTLCLLSLQSGKSIAW